MISKLLSLFKEHKHLAFFVIFFNALLALVKTVVDPIIMKILVDEALGEKNLELFLIIIVAAITLSISVRVGLYFLNIMKQKLINSISKNKTKKLVYSYFDTPYEKVSEQGEGYYISRVYDEPSKVAEKGTRLAISLFEKIISLIGAMAICLYLSWEVTLGLLIIVPVLFSLSRKYNRKIFTQSETEGENEASFREDMIRCLETYKLSNLFSLKDRVTNSAMKVMDRYLDSAYERNKTSEKYQTISNIFLSLAESIVLIIAATAVFFGSMTVGGLLAYMSGFWKMMNSIVSLTDLLPELSNLMAFVKRIDKLEESREVKEKNLVTDIVLKDAKVGYLDQPVIDGLNINIEHGTKVLIQGDNGCGKSTLLHALSGFIKTSGEAKIPDQSRVSALLAPLKFFNGTLSEHLQLSALTQKQRSFVESMLVDFGLIDKLDDYPANFSEGEKRKAQIAICLAKDAQLYIFDEPLAAIDVNSKDTVMNWIKKRTLGNTLIMVLHGDEQFYNDFDSVIDLNVRNTAM